MAIWQEIHPPSSNPLRLQDGTAPPRYQRRETLLFLQPKSLRSRRQSQPPPRPIDPQERSEEHTSELQSLMRISYAVFCLKKTNTDNKSIHIQTLQDKTLTQPNMDTS